MWHLFSGKRFPASCYVFSTFWCARGSGGAVPLRFASISSQDVWMCCQNCPPWWEVDGWLSNYGQFWPGSRFWVLNRQRFIFSKPEDSSFVNRITHTKLHIHVFIIYILYLYLSRNQSNSVVVGFNKVNILTFKNINLMSMLYLCNYTWYSCEVSQGVRRRRQR